MTKELSPQRWANDLTTLLNAAYKAERFPVKVKQLAMDYSRQRFPNDPITDVLGDALPGFEGALFPAADGKKGWGIIYNSAIKSPGRINFTLAHEFGHYLLHRLKYPDGINCGEEDMATWDSEYGRVESQANEFAATLLMPFDDFRRQIDARAWPDLETLGGCADRYEVSLIAATLRWSQFTDRRSVLVVSNDGFIRWARSSEAARKTGLYYKTRNRPPIEIPAASLAAQRSLIAGHAGEADHDRGVWLNQPCKEYVLFSDQYDLTISLLHFDDAPIWSERSEEPEQDTYDRMVNRKPSQS